MASSATKTILIIGATGQQGRAVISALLASPESSNLKIVAVTRDPSSPAAQRLASHPKIQVIAGDLSNPDAIFAAAPTPIWAVYHVQTNTDAEEPQGKALVLAAIINKVHHIVYASGDRGGPTKSDDNPTSVKNFRAKHSIEQHLRDLAAATATTYTILRPVTFFENLSGDLHGRGFARMWEQMGAKPLKFVATADIGWFAAESLLRGGEDERYRNAALTLVGDELTQKEADEVFKEVMMESGAKKVNGKGMPLAPCVIGSAVKYFKGDTVGDMFAWFEREGYGGSVEVCKEFRPDMMGWRAWLMANKENWAH